MPADTPQGKMYKVEAWVKSSDLDCIAKGLVGLGIKYFEVFTSQTKHFGAGGSITFGQISHSSRGGQPKLEVLAEEGMKDAVARAILENSPDSQVYMYPVEPYPG
tara:strand:- start:123 stop:437 length:315 start_codon:yes stop_codon:yes gene_type:complete